MLDRIRLEPGASGEFEWYGWSDPQRWRRRWAEDGMIGPDDAILMVVRGAERLGFVAWHKQVQSRSSYCWNMGINLVPEARGKGYGTEAQRLLVDYLFRNTMVERIEAGTEVDNLAEQRALEKVGFVREGVIRSSTFRDGAWRDGILYSIIRPEWAAGR